MNFCLFSKKTTSSIPVHPRANKTKEIGYDGLPIGTRKLNFYVDTGATFGSEKIPLVYGSLDSPAEVVAAVTFDTGEDCTGDSVDVTFKATAAVRANVMPNATKCTYEFETGFLTEQILLQKKWTLPVSRVEGKPSVIRKGTYTSYIRVALDPTLPSSFLPSKSFKGGIQYSFHPQVSRFDSHIRKTVATAEADQRSES
ncbi:hypothetical protein BGZ52_001127 [Haplosporangium bisporale]|nr:hypothetical protein BGZ52_001127 [Haplosporangium bisporale]KFH63825.1 hypothetical protein MVEG_10518 [Podila verticillata NRRL 6337]